MPHTHTIYILQRTRQSMAELPRLELGMHYDVLHRNVSQLLKLLEAVNEEDREIQNDSRLTEDGKRDRLLALATKADNDLKFLRDAVADQEAALKQKSDLLFTDIGNAQLDPAYGYERQPALDPVLKHLREQEIRGVARTRKPHEIDEMYIVARQAGDREIATALREAPGGSLVSKEVQTRTDSEYAQKRYPMVFDNFRKISRVHEHLQSLAAHVEHWLGTLGLKRAPGDARKG